MIRFEPIGTAKAVRQSITSLSHSEADPGVLDGDTYDLPAIIVTAELRQTVHGLPLPTFGYRVKFDNDPKKHIDFSAVTHVAKGKGIPPFLLQQ